MKKQLLTAFSFTLLILFSNGQVLDSSLKKYNKPSVGYKLCPGFDVPMIAGGGLWTLYGFNKINNRDTIPASEILILNKENVESFDRNATNNYNRNALNVSNYLFYGSMPLPMLMLFDKKMRHDGVKIALLYLEAQAITGTIYTIAAMKANRFKPYTYNPNVPMDKRTSGEARNSFYAGHVAFVGTSTFFMAKAWSDYHPEMRNKWMLYALASGLTATTGIMQIKAGEHFPSDVIVGAILGPVVGVLVPHFHRNKKNNRMVLLPKFEEEGNGMTMLYRLNKQ